VVGVVCLFMAGYLCVAFGAEKEGLEERAINLPTTTSSVAMAQDCVWFGLGASDIAS
jgi:hypothetical protein